MFFEFRNSISVPKKVSLIKKKKKGLGTEVIKAAATEYVIFKLSKTYRKKVFRNI